MIRVLLHALHRGWLGKIALIVFRFLYVDLKRVIKAEQFLVV